MASGIGQKYEFSALALSIFMREGQEKATGAILDSLVRQQFPTVVLNADDGLRPISTIGLAT